MKKSIGVVTILCALVGSQASTTHADNWWGNLKPLRGSGTQAEEVRTIDGDIRSIEFGTVGVLYVDIGDEESLVISGDDNIIERIETDVSGHTLIIESENGVSPKPRLPLRFYLTLKTLERVEINSSGDIELPEIETDRFRIRVNSSGDLRMDGLICDEADIRIESSGDIVIEDLMAEILEAEIGSSGDLVIRDGRATEQYIEIHSSGDYKARDVISERARVSTSSSGDAYVRVTEFLEAETSSSGDINYYGSPRLHADETSSGDIRSRGN